MAAINNFSLVGIGSSVKLGKGGIVLAQSGGKLTVDTVALATESFVTGQNYLTDATASSAGYLKIADINALNYIDSSELTTALGAYTTTATLESTVAGYGFIKLSDISATYVDTTELATALGAYTTTTNLSGYLTGLGDPFIVESALTTALADYTTTAELTTYGITDGGSLDTDVDALGYLKSADLSGYLTSATAATTYQPLDADLTAIAGLTGTAGLLHTDGSGVWTVDGASYLTTGAASSTYALINNPTFTGTVTLAADPVSALQAATKQYVDGIAAGLTFKAAVRVATTANVGTYSTGEITGAPDTVDGVTLVAGDRILVKDQTAGLENGIYSVTTVGTGANGVWDRAADFDEPSEVNGGTFVFVTEGSTLADKGFVLVSDNPITLGTDALNWSQYSSTGTVSVAAGTGISVSESLGAYTVSLANISGVSGSYGAAGKTITLTVDGQGRITAVADTDITIATSQVTGLDTALSGKASTTEVDAIESAVGLNTDGTFATITGNYTGSATTVAGAIQAVDTQVKTNTDAIATKASQTEVDAVETAVGLNTDGTLPAFAGNYTTGSTSVIDAINDIDTQVKTNTDAIATKASITYVDDADALKLDLAGGTMSGDIAMGGNAITGLVDPTNDQDAATKAYVDSAVTAASSNGDHTAKVAIAFGTTSGNLLATLPTGSIVSRIIVKVATPFDNAATITATQNSTTVEDGSFSDLTTAGIYVIDTFYDVTTGGALTYSITGSPTVGAGTVYVEYTI